MYRTSSKSPPVYLFFFGVQNRFFFCGAKEKVVLAPAGQAKNQLQGKIPRFPANEKVVFLTRATPHPYGSPAAKDWAMVPAGQAENNPLPGRPHLRHKATPPHSTQMTPTRITKGADPRPPPSLILRPLVSPLALPQPARHPEAPLPAPPPPPAPRRLCRR